MGTPEIEPETAGCEAQTLPLCYTNPRALIPLQKKALLGFSPTTLCCSVI